MSSHETREMKDSEYTYIYFIRGGNKMKYEKPEMEVLQLELVSIVCTSSVTGSGTGTGDQNNPDAPDEW